MCKEWKESFESFSQWAYANGYRDDLTIDRIDNNGNYSPENCRWVDTYTQNINKRITLKYSLNGETKPLREWCRIKNMNYKAVWYRLSKGWSFEKAITKPIVKGSNHG